MFNLLFLVTLFIAGILEATKLEPRIIGGDYTDIKRFPHSVLIIVDCKDPFLCGGSILTDRIVLTAGHCLFPCASVVDVSILLKYGHEISEYMASTMASKFVTHGQYDDDALINDIGMVYAEHAMDFNDNVQRIALTGPYYFYRPRYAYVAGWGIVNSRGDSAISLKYAKQSFSSANDCYSLHRNSPGIICTGGVYAEEYPHQGDSGSALIIFDYIQIGIVSFKHPQYGLIGYTNTTYYYDWIVSTSRKIHCS